MKTRQKHDYNSVTNQSIKGDLVQRDVYLNVNELVQHIFSTGNYGDYETEAFNLMSQEDYESAAEDNGWYEELDGWWRKPEGGDDEYESAQEVCYGEHIDHYDKEPYEYWAVNPYFGEKLKEHGEIVEDFFGLTVWGRCTTGQAILLDWVISKIAEEMEILEGQENDWSKYK